MIADARAAGVGDIVAKFDRRALIGALNNIVPDARQAA
jgi:hypothetical protein